MNARRSSLPSVTELPRAELPRAELPRAELPRAELPRGEPRGGGGGRSGAAPPGAPAVVLVSRDRPLVDHVAALADAAGVALQVLPAAPAVPRAARLVLVGLDAAAGMRPGRRGVLLVVRVDGADPPDGVWRQAVQLGAEGVSVLPEGEAALIERLLDAAAPAARAPVLGVVGACGGAGASTLALCLAVCAAQRGLHPVLVDADPFGGGLDVPLGAERLPGLRWPELPWAAGRLPAGVVGRLLPEVCGVRLLTCRRGEAVAPPAEALPAVLNATTRESDLVLVDLPHRLGEAELAVLPRFRLVLLVVPGRPRAVAAGGQVAAVLGAHAPDVRVVVREPLAPGLEPEAVAEALMFPLAGQLRPEAGVAVALDAGRPGALPRRGPLTSLSHDLLDALLEAA